MTRRLAHYRPDVDGLRALAVVSIILYHLRAMPLPGAFVTLDIFFVISGYLIGAHIARDVEAGRFSLKDFYLRRVRRILPALATMLAFTAAACTWLLYPEALARFGASLAAASVAGANIYFWSATDYFAPPAQTAPLLHTWSLGVEEQYYFVFPALMLLLYRVLGARRVPLGIAAIAFTSLSVATWGAFTDPTTAFYWPHTRMWEFLAGTAILYVPTGLLDRRWAREAVVAAGLALVLASVLLLRTTMPFPGITALPAVLGTAMVIAGGSHGGSVGTRLLSIAPARWIGLISYSLYLWHWPLILVYKAVKPAQYLSGPDKAGLFLATFAVGYLSWRCIEEPFRRSRRPAPIVFGTALAASALLAAAGLLLWRTDGLPQRIDPAELALVRYERSRVHPRAPGCHLDTRDPPSAFAAGRCLTPNSQTILLGDSHANHLWQALQARSATPVSQATAAGCRPTLDNRRSRDPDCRAVTGAAFAFLDQAHPPASSSPPAGPGATFPRSPARSPGSRRTASTRSSSARSPNTTPPSPSSSRSPATATTPASPPATSSRPPPPSTPSSLPSRKPRASPTSPPTKPPAPTPAAPSPPRARPSSTITATSPSRARMTSSPACSHRPARQPARSALSASPIPTARIRAVAHLHGQGADGVPCPKRARPAVAKTTPVEFFNQVKAETKKVVWPSRKETVMTGVMVLVMTTILALFFLGVDSIFEAVVRALLKFAQGQ